MNHKEKSEKSMFEFEFCCRVILSIWDNTLVWEAMDITVKQGVEEPNDIVVGKEEDGKHNNNKYLRYCPEIRNIHGGTNTTH